MKKIFYLSITFALLIAACNKETNAYPPKISTDIDPALYPGNFNDYVYPTFIENTNTLRNVMIEDFTGHKCIFCPRAADTALAIGHDYPDRVFVSTVHTDPTGTVTLGSFQSTSSPDFEYDFTNTVGLEIGGFFGNLPGNGFFGNPSGNVSRVPNSSSQISFGQGAWRAAANNILSVNDLKVNLQAEVNFFPSTSGAYIHIEVEKLVILSSPLRLVVAFYNDSIVKPQKMDDNSTNLNYVHRDLLISHINGNMNGQEVGDANKDTNGKYYFNYSYQIPSDYNAENCHLLIYVMDMQTKEIYQVIKKKFI